MVDMAGAVVSPGISPRWLDLRGRPMMGLLILDCFDNVSIAQVHK
jgi:hypothetical protein